MAEGSKVAPARGFSGEGPRAPAPESWSLSGRLGLVFATILLAVLWAAGLLLHSGSGAAENFFTAYLVEQSLSLDNLFIFLLLFRHFQVPPTLQPMVLFYGLVAAMPLRAVMILVGVEVIAKFRWVSLLFAAVLVFSGGKIITGADGEKEGEDLGDKSVVRLARLLLFGRVHPRLEDDRFVTRNSVGKLVATPLLVCLCCIEISDIIFAVDSIPAVIGITPDFATLFPSNILAICTVRSLYALIAKTVSELDYLESASGLVLIYVGVEMALGFFGVDIPPGVSLALILVILAGGTLLSMCFRDSEGEGDSAVDLEDPCEDEDESRSADCDGQFGDPDDSVLLDSEAERRALLSTS